MPKTQQIQGVSPSPDRGRFAKIAFESCHLDQHALTGAKSSFLVIFAVNEGCFVSNMVVIWYVFAIDIIAIVK